MKKLLMLGASKNQLPLILSAKELGYYVICCDNTTTNPGLKYVDKHYQVNFMDRSRVLEIAKEEAIDGVISNSEPAMLVVAYIGEQLGLVGNTEESVNQFMEKTNFRRLQKKIGIYCPKSFVVENAEDAVCKMQQMNLPIIMKPEQSSGSRGTSKITSFDNIDEIRNTFEYCRTFSRNGNVAIEEFVEMPASNITIEGEIFVYNGEILWDGMFYDLRCKHNTFIPMSDCGPMLDNSEFALIKSVLTKIIKESGIQFGQYNPELYFTKNGELFVIEINPRQGGNNPEFIKIFNGVDLNKLLVSLCVGDEIYWNELHTCDRDLHYVISHIIFSPKEGLYQGMYISPEIEKYVKSIREDYNKGELVPYCENATKELGKMFLEFDNIELQHVFFKDIEKYIYPIVK